MFKKFFKGYWLYFYHSLNNTLYLLIYIYIKLNKDNKNLAIARVSNYTNNI